MKVILVFLALFSLTRAKNSYCNNPCPAGQLQKVVFDKAQNKYACRCEDESESASAEVKTCASLNCASGQTCEMDTLLGAVCADPPQCEYYSGYDYMTSYGMANEATCPCGGKYNVFESCDCGDITQPMYDTSTGEVASLTYYSSSCNGTLVCDFAQTPKTHTCTSKATNEYAVGCGICVIPCDCKANKRLGCTCEYDSECAGGNCDSSSLTCVANPHLKNDLNSPCSVQSDCGAIPGGGINGDQPLSCHVDYQTQGMNGCYNPLVCGIMYDCSNCQTDPGSCYGCGCATDSDCGVSSTTDPNYGCGTDPYYDAKVCGYYY